MSSPKKSNSNTEQTILTLLFFSLLIRRLKSTARDTSNAR